jgi:hypothetical protein
MYTYLMFDYCLIYCIDTETKYSRRNEPFTFRC